MLYTHRYVLLITAVLFSTMSTPVWGDLVNIGTVGTTVMSPGTQSGTITIPIFDTNSGTPVTMLDWSLGLRIVPLGGATGTVTIDQSSIAYPGSGGNVFPNPFPGSGPTVGDNNPAAGDFTISSSDALGVGVTVPNQAAGKGLVSFKVNASAGASGTFALRLVDSGGAGARQNTYWDDENVVTHDFLINGSAFTSGVEIGQFNVAAAVPEPGSLLLTGSVALVAGWRVRRKRRAAGQAATTDETMPSDIPVPNDVVI